MLLFQTGAHNLAKRGRGHILVQTMGPRLDMYVSTLLNIKRRADKLAFNMVVVTSPSYPDKRVPGRASRNNHNLAALSRLLQDKLCTYNVSVFDEFSMLVSQQGSAPPHCGIHYLCRIPGQGVRGNTGIIALHMLMTDVCYAK